MPMTNNTSSIPDYSILQGKSTEGISEATPKMQAPEQPDKFNLYEATLGATGRSIESSIIGSATKVAYESGLSSAASFLTNVTNDDRYELTQADKNRLIDSGIPVSSYDTVLRGVTTPEEFERNFQLVTKNRENDAKNAEQGLTGQIFGGLGEAIGDPLSFVPVAGIASKVTTGGRIMMKGLLPKLAENTITAGISEQFLRNQVTGLDADVTSAMAGAVMFTGAFHMAGKGVNHVLGKTTESRINASETARNSGNIDPATNYKHDGTSRIIRDPDGDLEITESGRVMSAGIVPPKASTQGRFWHKDLATTIHQSDDLSVRAIGEMLTSPVQGYKDAGYTIKAPTADTINRNLKHRDSDLMGKMQDTLDEYTERNIWSGKQDARGDAQKQLYRYIEGKVAPEELTPKMRQLGDEIKQFFELKASYMADPSVLSGKAAPSLHTDFIKGQTYVPRIYNTHKLNEITIKHGSEETQRLVRESWRDAYNKASNKEALQTTIMKDYPEATAFTDEILEDYLKRKAFGVVNRNEGVTSSSMLFDAETGSKTTPDFLKHRVPFDTDGVATAADGSSFSVSDLLDYNLESILPAYSRSVNGRVSIVASTGKTLDDFDKMIVGVTDQKGRKALEETRKVLLGESRTDYSFMDIVADTLRDTSFSLANGGMALANMAEIMGNMFRKGIVPAVLKNLAEAAGGTLGMPITKTAKREFTDAFMGRQVSLRMATPYRDYVAGMANRLGKEADQLSIVEKGAIRTRYAASKLSEKSPFTKALNKTQEAIVNMGNEVGMGEMLAHSTGGAKSHILSDKFIAIHHIDKSVRDNAIEFFKHHMPDGQFSQSKLRAMEVDPRSNDVRTILNAFNDSLIMKTEGSGQQLYEPAGFMGRLLMQFKRFATMSSQYAVRSGKAMVKHKDVDTMLWVLGSSIAAGGFITVQTGYKTIGMSESERKQYWDDNMSGDKFLAGMLKRHPLLAAPSLGYDMLNVLSPSELPYAGLGKTTAEDMFKPSKKSNAAFSMDKYGSGVAKRLSQQVPALRPIYNVGNVAVNSARLSYDSFVDDNYLKGTAQRNAVNSLNRSLKGLTPNDPTVRLGYDKIMELFGVEQPKPKR